MKPKRDVIPLPDDFDPEESKDALATLLVRGFGVPPNSRGIKDAQNKLEKVLVKKKSDKLVTARLFFLIDRFGDRRLFDNKKKFTYYIVFFCEAI